MQGMDLSTSGRIASLMGALKIEHLGPQNQRFDYAEFSEQFRQQFGYALR
jgi:adenosine kinase